MSYFVFLLFISLLLIGLISLIIPILSFLLSDRVPDKEKTSVYECGFNPIYQPGKPFSIRFFIIAILFLVFDLEIILLFPWSLSVDYIFINGQIIMLFFFIILVIGLTYEWYKGGLDWE